MGGYAKIARDMTESQTQQASRDELLAMEKQANELKDQFLAVMSHELKHPLNLIQVNTELLISQPEVRALPAVIRAGETIRLAVASQTKIIDDLLDLSRARTGKLTLRLARVDLNEVKSLIAEAARNAATPRLLGGAGSPRSPCSPRRPARAHLVRRYRPPARSPVDHLRDDQPW